MPTIRRQFGNLLKAIRLDRKLTQEEFAELVDISVDFLSLIERGINSPSFEVLERMGKKLDMPVRDLFDFRWPSGRPSRWCNRITRASNLSPGPASASAHPRCPHESHGHLYV